MRRSNGTVLPFIVFVTIGLAVGACGSAQQQRDSAVPQSARTGVGAEISERVLGYIRALEQGNADAAADYWTEDSRLIGPGFDLNHAEVIRGLRSIFDAGTRVDVLSRRTVELFEHGDIVYEVAEAEEVLLPVAGSSPDTMRNNIFVRWKKGSDGKWRFHRALLGPAASAR